jgi:hypothetical protein
MGRGVSKDGRYFYERDDGISATTVFRVESDGRLTHLQKVTGQGLPTLGAQGLAVR